MGYGIGKTLDIPFDEAMTSVREALSAQGFGVLTEIDMSATLKQKLGVDVDRQVILGACNPPLAYRAVQAEASIGLLLPCNVLVRDAGDGRTHVEAMDPQVMVSVTDNSGLREVADEAAEKLNKALDSL
ncbi:MAG TPA: DUF302 domain-containing protein [Actinomycetales bacterium]|nr:DUF302 domain-containing protein [Actinomycetales bacterium]